MSNIFQPSAETPAMPQFDRKTLEDEVTHILSEWFNDHAPLREEFYRPIAWAIVTACAKVVRARAAELEGAMAAGDLQATHIHGVIEGLALAIEARKE